MTEIRSALMRHAQQFFETELAGIYRYQDAIIAAPETELPPPGRKVSRKGVHRDIVAMQFGDYSLAVYGPEESPPLGRIELDGPGGFIEGPLDRRTWQIMGAKIRGLDHG